MKREMENRLDTGFIQTLLGLVFNAVGRSCSKYIIEKQGLFRKELRNKNLVSWRKKKKGQANT